MTTRVGSFSALNWGETARFTCKTRYKISQRRGHFENEILHLKFLFRSPLFLGRQLDKLRLGFAGEVGRAVTCVVQPPFLV